MKKGYLKMIASTWAQRAQAELSAEARFKLLAEELTDLGAKQEVIILTKKAKQEEKKHAQICSQVACSYGHPTGFESFSEQKTIKKSWNQRMVPEERLLCETTLMCCITETINASLLNSIYIASKNTSTSKVIRTILKDEVKHSQIGWAHLSSETQKRNCQFLSHYLREMLEISVKDELFLPILEEKEDEGFFHYGVMPFALRLQQFKDTLNEVVFPGFEKFGIKTSQAKKWLKEKTLPHSF